MSSVSSAADWFEMLFHHEEHEGHEEVVTTPTTPETDAPCANHTNTPPKLFLRALRALRGDSCDSWLSPVGSELRLGTARSGIAADAWFEILFHHEEREGHEEVVTTPTTPETDAPCAANHTNTPPRLFLLIHGGEGSPNSNRSVTRRRMERLVRSIQGKILLTTTRKNCFSSTLVVKNLEMLSPVPGISPWILDHEPIVRSVVL
jgi:hypothetical protein